MKFLPVAQDNSLLDTYADFLRTCFPAATKYDRNYLDWLYYANPDGRVVGFDAWDNGALVAHYVCVPAWIDLCGRRVKALLSLNTATRADYQGRGLFTKLAEMTYRAAEDEGFACIFGVANANSTPGFTRKLGFQLVQPLEARVGFGDLGIGQRPPGTVQFERAWSAESFGWRCANPQNPVVARSNSARTLFLAPAEKRLLSVCAEMPGAPVALPGQAGGARLLSPLRLFIGLVPGEGFRFANFVSIPERLRPSPLNFIYRPLAGSPEKLERSRIAFSFLDFDAY